MHDVLAYAPVHDVVTLSKGLSDATFGHAAASGALWRIDPAHRLNVYTVAPRDYLGWAYLPWSLPEDHVLHGVVVHYGSLPGGHLAPYNLGRTLSHEVGHYLGLFHTFQGGCEEPGDYVEDTPAEATPNYECPESRDTCPAPGEDPIHNYMDYSEDGCYESFTRGQETRMKLILARYRPWIAANVPALPGERTGTPVPAPAPSPSAIIMEKKWQLRNHIAIYVFINLHSRMQ